MSARTASSFGENRGPRTHKHRTKAGGRRMQLWSHCVANGGNCGSAHGGVVYIDRCACGAVKMTERNGAHEARGRWAEPEGGRK